MKHMLTSKSSSVNCPFYFKIGVCRHGTVALVFTTGLRLARHMYQSPDAGFHGGVDQHGNIQQSDPRKLQEHFEVCA